MPKSESRWGSVNFFLQPASIQSEQLKVRSHNWLVVTGLMYPLGWHGDAYGYHLDEQVFIKFFVDTKFDLPPHVKSLFSITALLDFFRLYYARRSWLETIQKSNSNEPTPSVPKSTLVELISMIIE
jgi:hypothetical protein